MKKRTLGLLVGASLGFGMVAVGCDDGPSDGEGGGDNTVLSCKDDNNEHCIEIDENDTIALLTAVAELQDNTTIILAAGTYELDTAVTIRNNGIRLIGKGADKTILDFGTAVGQFNGIDVIGDDFLVQDFGVIDSPKDGMRVEASDGVTFRRISATWSQENNPNNGSYGIYPVKSKNVLVEGSYASNASDSGLYVGQCENVIVRNNIVEKNVAGLEIENTQFAEVYGNHVEDNTGGLVIFDLTGNPIPGRDIWMHDNVIINNNRENFAPNGIVGAIPPGTGTFAMASRRVQITDNTYENNGTVDIAFIDGIVGDTDNTDPSDWVIQVDSVEADSDNGVEYYSGIVGDWKNMGLDVCEPNPDVDGYEQAVSDWETAHQEWETDHAAWEADEDPEKGDAPVEPQKPKKPKAYVCHTPTDNSAYDNAKYVSNWRTYNIVVSGNTHKNSGTNVGGGLFGGIFQGAYGKGNPVDAIFYNASSESSLPTAAEQESGEKNAADVSNDNHICLGDIADDATVGIGSLLAQLSGDVARALFSVNKADLGAFACNELEDGGAVETVVLPGVKN